MMESCEITDEDRIEYPEECTDLFICLECNFRTNDKNDLADHIALEHDQITDSPSEQVCEETNSTKYIFENMYKCEMCSFESTNRELVVEHINVAHVEEKLYKCDKCSFESRTRRSLKGHLKCHNQEQLYKCEECPYTGKRKGDLQRHITVKHRAKLYPSPKLHKCKLCGYETSELDLYREHLYKPHPWYECQKCIYKTRVKMSLTDHVLSEHTDKIHIEYKCDRCKYLATSRDDLKQHIILSHTTYNGLKWYKCASCSYKTLEKYLLTQHMLRVHDQESVKRMSCKVCGENFLDWIELREHHLTTHSDEWFQCHVCKLTTQKRDKMEEHVLNEHVEGNIKIWYGCYKCKFYALSREIIDVHVKQKHRSIDSEIVFYEEQEVLSEQIESEHESSTETEENNISGKKEEGEQTDINVINEDNNLYTTPEVEEVFQTQQIETVHPNSDLYSLQNEVGEEKETVILQETPQQFVTYEELDKSADSPTFITYEDQQEGMPIEYVTDNGTYLNGVTDQIQNIVHQTEDESNAVLIHIPDPEESKIKTNGDSINKSQEPETAENGISNGITQSKLIELDLDEYLGQKIHVGTTKTDSFTIIGEKRSHSEITSESSTTAEENNNGRNNLEKESSQQVKKQKFLPRDEETEDRYTLEDNNLTELHVENNEVTKSDVAVNVQSEVCNEDILNPELSELPKEAAADAVNEEVTDISCTLKQNYALDDIGFDLNNTLTYKSQVLSEIENDKDSLVEKSKEDNDFNQLDQKEENVNSDQRFVSFDEFYSHVRRRFSFGTISLYQKKFSSKDGAKALMFANDDRIRHLKNVKIMHVDTTFRIETDEHFQPRLLTVLVWAGDRYFPIMYALFNKKSLEIFKMIFAHLRDTLAPHIKPQEIIMSYEAILYYSLGETYPDALIGGSVFYYAQKLQQKLHSLNGQKHRHGNIKIIFAMLIMLPFLPQESFMSGLEYVESKAVQLKISNKLRPLFDYVRSEWVNRVTLDLFCVYRSDYRVVTNVEWPFRKLRGILNADGKLGPVLIMGVVESLFKLETCMHQSMLDESQSAKREVVKAWLYLEKYSNTNINTFFSKISQYINYIEKQLKIWKTTERDEDEDELISAANFIS